MARPLRIQFPGGLYHVTARGNGRQPLFAADPDRERFLTVLARVVAHCLMGNHYDLLLETPDANLSRAMRQLNGVYSQAFNRRHERPRHVLEGRYPATAGEAPAPPFLTVDWILSLGDTPVRAEAARRYWQLVGAVGCARWLLRGNPLTRPYLWATPES
jgi:REP element-mobilizing transposase RayT